MDMVQSVKKLRRFVASLSVVTLLASFALAGVASAATYKDVPSSSPYYTWIEQGAAAGIFASDASHQYFREADNVSRVELVAATIRALGAPTSAVTAVVAGDDKLFPDLSPSMWAGSPITARQYFLYAYHQKLLSGYSDGRAGATDPIIRRDAAAILARAFNLQADANKTLPFTDMKVGDPQYAFVKALFDHSVVSGSNDPVNGALKFWPTTNLNRGGFAKMLVASMNGGVVIGTFNVKSAVATSATQAQVCYSAQPDPVSSLVAANYTVTTTGGTVLNVTSVAAGTDPTCVVLTTASQSANTTYTVAVKNVVSKTAGALGGNSVSFGGFGTVVAGALTASLSVDNPAQASLVSGQATADLAHFTFTGTGTLSNVTLQRTGVSDSSTLTNVYLYNGATRVTDSASVNTAGQIVFTNVNLPVTGSMMLSVKADLATAAHGTVGVTLSSFTVVGSTTVAQPNLAGNIMGIIDGAGLIAGVVVASGLSTPYNTVPSATVNAGTKSYTVWSAPVQVNTRDVLLKGMSLRYIGSAPNDALSNVTLFVNGVSKATGTVNSLGYVVFDLSSKPETLKTGSTQIEVRADIEKGTSRNFAFSLQNASDIMAEDSQLHVNVSATTGGPTNFATSQAGTITISTGSVTLELDPTFQAMTDVTGGAANAVIGKFKVHAYGEDVKVNSLTVTPSITGATPATSSMNNVVLYFNGSQVGSSKPFTGSALTYQLGSSMIVPAGQDSTLEVHADIQNASNVNYSAGTVAVTVNAGSANGQGMNSQNTFSVPTAAVNTTGLTVQTALLAGSKNPGFLSQTVNPNTAGVKIGSFILQNQGTSEGVRVTSLAVGFNPVSTVGNDVFLGTSTYAATYTTCTAGTTTPTGTCAANVPTSAVDTYVIYTVGSTSGMTVGDTLTFVRATTNTVGVVSNIVDATHVEVKLTTVGSGAFSTGVVTGVSVKMPLTNLSNLVTSETSGSGNTPVNPTSTNNFSVDFTLAPGASKTVDVFANFGGARGGSVTPTLAITAFGTSSNQAANVAAFDGQTMSVSTGVFNVPSLVVSTSTTSQYIPAAVTATVPGNADATKATFNFTASNGLATITELKFTVSDNTTTGYDTVTAVKVGSVTSAPVNGVASLTGLNINVPNGGSGLNVDALVSYSGVGTTGVPSGKASTVSLSFVKYTIGGTTKTLILNNVAPNPNSVDAPTMTVVGSVPALSVNTTQQTGLVLGAENKVGEVTITANSKGDVAVHNIRFNIGNGGFASGFGLSASRLADSGSTIASFTCTEDNTTGTTYVDCLAAPDYQVNAGTSKTFSLYSIVAGVANASSVVSVSAQVDKTNFNWTDIAGGNSTSILDGVLIYNFPTGSYSVKQ